MSNTFSEAQYLKTKAALDECLEEHRRVIFIEDSTPEQRNRISLERNLRESQFHASMGWYEIKDQQRETLWNLMFEKLIRDDEFCFPRPFSTWDVGHIIHSSAEQLIALDADLIRKSLDALKRPALKTMDWHVIENVQHTWYNLDLNMVPSRDVEWPHEVFPCADPFYLVNGDMSCGLIAEVGGPVSIFGEPFFSELKTDLPLALTHDARID